MNVYRIHPVTDNPLFEGLGLATYSETLETWPRDWNCHPQTWQAKSLKSTWQIPEVEGNVRLFNDYPCINLSHPAFSQRAVDLLGDVLKKDGELLPVRHELGIYYFFNCTRLANVVDLSKSATNAGLADIGNLVFIDETLIAERLTDSEVFRERSLPSIVLCTQRFVDRVNSAGLQGFIFIPLWPLAAGVTYHKERFRMCKLAEKWKPSPLTTLEIKGNTVVLRLCCQGKKATKEEIAAADGVMTHLDKALYDPNQASSESYFGNVEGTDVVDFEIRIFISTPDNERLLIHLMPRLQVLPWPGKFYVVKRRGSLMDGQAMEEYVAVK
jgi:hypothetical protein